MIKHEFKRKITIVLSIIVALLLQMAPWPQSLFLFRPDWMMLIMAYWVLAIPHHFNIGSGFVIGLILDILSGATLGTHAVALSVVAYLLSLRFQMVRNLALWKQAMLIIFLSIIMNIVVFLVYFFVHRISHFNVGILWACLINGILWPWVFLILRGIRRRFVIS